MNRSVAETLFLDLTHAIERWDQVMLRGFAVEQNGERAPVSP